MTLRLSAKETADKLGFTTTNLKHYAALLEQNGHKIFRNTRNHREYTQEDLELLLAMQILNKDKSMLLDEAASLVMSSDTSIQDIISTNSKRMFANIREVSQDSEDNVREVSVINGYLNQLNERDTQYLMLLKELDKKLTEQMNENRQLREEINFIRTELTEIKNLRLEEISEPKLNFWQRIFKR